MADAISMQELIDARTDAKTLEEAVNGDAVTTVLSRLGESYPTLANALSQIDGKLDSADAQIKQAITDLFENGGLPATPFATKALMTASALVDGDYAMVTDDTANNGLYVKTAGAWVKSSYDPLRIAKSYTDSKAILSGSENLLSLTDTNGVIYGYISNKGHLYLPDLPTPKSSLQESLEILNSIDDKDDGSLFRFIDKNDTEVARFSQYGNMVVTDVVTRGGSVDTRLKNISNITLKSDKATILENRDMAVASRDKDPMLVSANFDKESNNANYSSIGSPRILRLSKDTYWVFYGRAGAGDFSSAGTTYYKVVTVQDDYSLSIGVETQLTTPGSDEYGNYMIVEAQPLYVNKGVHKGRIYVYLIKRYGSTRDEMVYIYTDNMGETWSEVMSMNPFIQDLPEKRLVAASPAKMIQMQYGEHAGRIIIPCWRAGDGYPSVVNYKSFIMYSDDGGETYKIGADSKSTNGNECAVAETVEGNLVFITRNTSYTKTHEVSYDGGLTLTGYRAMLDVPHHMIQSGFIQAKNRFDLTSEKLILTMPSRPSDGPSSRMDLAIYISYDNENFKIGKQIQTGGAQYSCIDIIDESHILVAHEDGSRTSIEMIVVNLKSIFLGE